MSFQPVSFGKYELVSRLAAGGMAEIFLARTKSIQGFEKYLVIKRILGHRTQDPEFVRMFLDEARVAATLDHPNIVQIYDVGHVDNEYFIAMEYLRGHNLIEIVRAGAKLGYAKPPLEHVVSALTQCCAGLHYAHDKRDFEGRSLEIVHRDVTPQNLVVSFDGSVKVVDFGIAKAATREVETLAGTLKGKIGYMSPEQCRGAPVDRRSDVFAVGIILFELTTGKRLYHERSDFDTLKKIIEGPVPSPRDLLPFYPAFLNAIVVRCLQKNPDDRYQSARDLHADLDAFGRDNQLVTGTVPLSQYMERIYADELATHKSADAAAMASSAQVTMTGSSASYLGESSRRSSSPMATPLAEARRQHLMRLGLQATIAVLLVLLGGGVVFWQTRRSDVPRATMAAMPAAQPIAAPSVATAPKSAIPGAPAAGTVAAAALPPTTGAALRAARRRRAVWRHAAHRSGGAGGQAHHRALELGGERARVEEGGAARRRAVDAFVLVRRRQGDRAERAVGEDAGAHRGAGREDRDTGGRCGGAEGRLAAPGPAVGAGAESGFGGAVDRAAADRRRCIGR
jgi:serine/threonine-protein kinase